MELGRPSSILKTNFLFFLIIIQFFILIFPDDTRGKRENLVYFPNTPYELNIYKIYGKKTGRTLMLIGGIQGNEPGGFLSADLYADMSLEKGNLVVVPRANFYSVLLNQRGYHGDMNRKFAKRPERMSMDDKIVSILKNLIAESDYLLNLHDGSGYYYPTYKSKWRNPQAFGQSVIADCEEYKVPDQKKVLKLGDMARTVIHEINEEIPNELHKFRFNNTRTDEPDSIHGEQLKSATYYALTAHHIPAFGIETSKFLPSIDLKVRYHNLAINAFMRLFDIVPEQPGLFLDPPELKYLIVSVNGATPIVIKNGQALNITVGDAVNIAHVEANYERGLSVDILGYGSLNDFRKDFSIYKNTSLLIRKDNKVFATIPIRVSEETAIGSRSSGEKRLSHFIIQTNGITHFIKHNETLEVIRGDIIKIVDILPESLSRQHGLIVNFKGFVGNWKNNTGEDRGYLINTASDLLKRYSIHGKKRVYNIVASHGKEVIGKMVVKIAEPSFEYLIIKLNNHVYALKNRETLGVSVNDYLTVKAVMVNFRKENEIGIRVDDNCLIQGRTTRIKDIIGGNMTKVKIELTRGALSLGEVYIKIG
jgi:hypothetical protein